MTRIVFAKLNDLKEGSEKRTGSHERSEIRLMPGRTLTHIMDLPVSDIRLLEDSVRSSPIARTSIDLFRQPACRELKRLPR